MGLAEWLVRYSLDCGFMWQEEQAGWYREIKSLQAAGQLVSPEVFASSLDDYANATGDMVSYSEALTWVRDVLAGRWTLE